ncbi:iron-regulated protein [Chitinibacter bivalviorum]|uniref:Iron-regulated protein n=1 Tax=Chitinibacter bivalviorum TaxID=2739434 RepID=A0A7H9BK40_9NEIS|nr:imelysin family protein [Chitinibacter bivalviorum]QLG88933.1 iron-regulated protein [Chitinibacter bivalviorum]
MKKLSLALLCAGMLWNGAVNAAEVSKQQVLDQYANVVLANYQDSSASARDMQSKIDAFLAKPTTESLKAAQAAWIEAREWYGQTEAFRFYAGPIDDDAGLEGFINAWPLDEVYIDYVKGKPKGGIINNPKVAITEKQLRGLNERGGEQNIATGWHAIEFLLWGQDLSKDSAGQRPYTDYTTAPNAERRAQYLKLVTQMLVDDLARVEQQWQASGNNYRAKFVKGDLDSIKKIFTGMGTLSRGELAGQRMEVALDTQNQEDEHSCFSDNTHRDIVTDAKGIQNAWEGRYVRRSGEVLEGASLKQLVAQKNAEIAQQTSSDIDNSVKLAEAIQAPFDREIVGKKDAPGRKRVQATVESLKAQSKDLVNAAKELGIKRLNTGV